MTTLLREVKDGIAVLTLHRPEKLNALDYALIDALAAALDELEADPAVRAVILTAEPIDAQQAASIGLVNRVVGHTALLEEARLLADQTRG